MSVEQIIVAVEIAIIAPLVVLLVVRQVRGQYLDRRRLWTGPVVLAAIGLVYVPLTADAVVPLDALLVTLALLASIGFGLGLGRLSTVRISAQPDRRGRRVLVRSGWKGGVVWITFIAARLALQPLASALHARLVLTAGVVLVLLAVARAATAVVVAPRLEAATAASRPVDRTEEGAR